jgi:hypothetical protein
MQRNGLDKQDQQIQKPISQVRIDYSKSRIIKKKKQKQKQKQRQQTIMF